MTEHNQPGSAAQFNEKNRSKAKTVPAPARIEDEVGLAQRSAEPLGMDAADGRDPVLAALQRGSAGGLGGGSLDIQVARLGDARLSTVQRQALAAEVGRVQGNIHLKSVIALLKSKPATSVAAEEQGRNSVGSRIVQLSPLSQELEMVWHTELKGVFFERLRNLDVSDQDVLDFVDRTLTGDDRWLARNIILYGRESNWPIPLQVERELRGWSGTINSSRVLSLLASANNAEFNAVMASMTQSQTRQFSTNISSTDRTTYAALIDRIETSRILATAGGMMGTLRWRGGSRPEPGAGYQVRETVGPLFRGQTVRYPNDFARWIRGTGPEPTNTSTMNCWEAVLFIAYRAGVVDRSWLESIHRDAAAAGRAAESGGASVSASVDAYYNVLERRLYSGSRNTFTYNPATGVGSPAVPAGNIIFINRIDHVMLSKGTTDSNGKHQVISLWLFPSHAPPGPIAVGSYGVLQDTTIEDVLVTGGLTGVPVEFAAAPW